MFRFAILYHITYRNAKNDSLRDIIGNITISLISISKECILNQNGNFTANIDPQHSRTLILSVRILSDKDVVATTVPELLNYKSYMAR